MCLLLWSCSTLISVVWKYALSSSLREHRVHTSKQSSIRASWLKSRNLYYQTLSGKMEVLNVKRRVGQLKRKAKWLTWCQCLSFNGAFKVLVLLLDYDRNSLTGKLKRRQFEQVSVRVSSTVYSRRLIRCHQACKYLACIQRPLTIKQFQSQPLTDRFSLKCNKWQ